MNFETSGRMVAMHAVLAQSPTIRKRWWSQRDSNPCLSLERTDGNQENQQDDTSEPSDE
jgi:hypothetical protein